jgi:preprotein translocase subunit Sss1
MAELKLNNRGRLRTVAFMVAAGLATLGWVGFLIWAALVLLGF